MNRCVGCPQLSMSRCKLTDRPVVLMTICPGGRWKGPPYSWRIPPPIFYVRRKPNLVVTVAIGEKFQELLSYTGPSFAAYAHRCNADYIVISNSTQVWWGLEKFRIQPLVADYDRTLFVDADCYIRPSTPNVFLLPRSHLHIHDDYSLNKNISEWLPREWMDVMATQYDSTPPIARCLNTGFVVCTHDHAGIWTPPVHPITGDHCNEQIWIDRNIYRMQIPHLPLPLSMNLQYWMDELFFSQYPLAHVIHLANCSHDLRLRYLKKEAAAVATA